MSQYKGKTKDFNYHCSYCEQQIKPIEMELRAHIQEHVERLDINIIIKDFYNQYCKTCDTRQNKEYLK